MKPTLPAGKKKDACRSNRQTVPAGIATKELIMEREFQYDAIPGLHIYQDETGGFVVIKNHGEVRPILDNGALIKAMTYFTHHDSVS